MLAVMFFTRFIQCYTKHWNYFASIVRYMLNGRGTKKWSHRAYNSIRFRSNYLQCFWATKYFRFIRSEINKSSTFSDNVDAEAE